MVGKATFFNYYFQHACFMCSGNVGSLYETTATVRSNGFFTFLRLVGTVYFKSTYHLCVYGHETPYQSFNSLIRLLIHMQDTNYGLNESEKLLATEYYVKKKEYGHVHRYGDTG
uniref:Uncharacterized protein n=1 Tax=Amphimedon queenslandica TaxID=400682 RepID=A0A1X7UF67_AMPQE